MRDASSAATGDPHRVFDFVLAAFVGQLPVFTRRPRRRAARAVDVLRLRLRLRLDARDVKTSAEQLTPRC